MPANKVREINMKTSSTTQKSLIAALALLGKSVRHVQTSSGNYQPLFCSPKINEEEARRIMRDSLIHRFEYRNLTLHLYQEALAEALCKKVPQYYELMKQYATSL